MTGFREGHRADVLAFLRQNFPGRDWEITLPPHGTGHESYFVRSGEQVYFVKLGIQTDRYQVIFALGLSPRLLATGSLTDGTALVVQEKSTGGNHPAWISNSISTSSRAVFTRPTTAKA